MTEAKHTELDALIDSLGLTYRAQFVPWSDSRSAVPNPKINDYNINWRIFLRGKTGAALQTDYMQGWGHLPNNVKPKAFGRMLVDEAEAIKRTCETGNTSPWSDAPGFIGKKTTLPAPLLRDVLYSLLMDADAINYASFEDWAIDFGYDVDSRKAESIYRACLEIGLKLRAMIGNDALEQLRTAFQDY